MELPRILAPASGYFWKPHSEGEAMHFKIHAGSMDLGRSLTGLSRSNFSLCKTKPLGWAPLPGPALARTFLTDQKSNPGAFSCRNHLTNKYSLKTSFKESPHHPLEASEFPVCQGIVVFPPRGDDPISSGCGMEVPWLFGTWNFFPANLTRTGIF